MNDYRNLTRAQLRFLRASHVTSAGPKPQDWPSVIGVLKCRHCGELYEPDYRNRWHQQYCSRPVCQQASKAASQKRWLAPLKSACICLNYWSCRS